MMAMVNNGAAMKIAPMQQRITGVTSGLVVLCDDVSSECFSCVGFGDWCVLMMLLHVVLIASNVLGAFLSMGVMFPSRSECPA